MFLVRVCRAVVIPSSAPINPFGVEDPLPACAREWHLAVMAGENCWPAAAATAGAAAADAGSLSGFEPKLLGMGVGVAESVEVVGKGQGRV